MGGRGGSLGTESCNLALRGVARASDGNRNRIITVITEHPAVLETVKDLGQSGYESVILPVGSDGLLDPAALERELDERTPACVRDGSEQRNRRAPAPGPDLRPVPGCWRVVSYRRNTGRRTYGKPALFWPGAKYRMQPWSRILNSLVSGYKPHRFNELKLASQGSCKELS